MNATDVINLELSSSLLGFVSLNKDVTFVRNYNIILRNDKNFTKDQVMLISGGGAGHEPFCFGFIGNGMLSAAVCGNIFTSPSVTRWVGFFFRAGVN